MHEAPELALNYTQTIINHVSPLSCKAACGLGLSTCAMHVVALSHARDPLCTEETTQETCTDHAKCVAHGLHSAPCTWAKLGLLLLGLVCS